MISHTDAALRSLDAAGATLTVGEQQRAEATLEGILSSPPSVRTPPPVLPSPPRRSRRRLLLIATTALVLIVGSVVVRADRDGDAAYASWTATPVAASADDLDAAGTACQEMLQRDDTIDGVTARLVLAERRGDYVALLYRTEDPDLSAPCLVRNPQGSADVDDLDFGVAGTSGPALKPPAAGFTQGAVFEHDDGAPRSPTAP